MKRIDGASPLTPPAPSEEIEGMLTELRVSATMLGGITTDEEGDADRAKMHAQIVAAESALRTAFSSLREDRERLDWLEAQLTPGEMPVEVYLAGLRQPMCAASAYQVETVPADQQNVRVVNAPALRDAIDRARA